MKNPKNWVGFLTGKDFDMLGADKIKEGELNFEKLIYRIYSLFFL